MQDVSPLESVHSRLSEDIAALRAVTGGGADADTRIAALVMCETLTRQIEQLSVALIGGLDRDGTFTDRGYSRPAGAVADLLGCDGAQAWRRVRAAEQVTERVSLDGQLLPARLPATAAAFAAGQISLRHVEVVVEALGSPAAARLTPEVWAGAEEQLAKHAGLYRPRELGCFARDLIGTLDQDGAEPDEHEPPQLNELHVSRTGTGGKLKGELDAVTFDAVATALDALARPTGKDDLRSLGERYADALGDIARHTLDHGDTPMVGGERPHLNVVMTLAELEGRCRNAVLDYGGTLTATDLRMLACDARIVPVVLGGDGQPLDLGRAVRTVTPHLRRAVVVRDKGCAFPGRDKPPSWAEVHHILEWQYGGCTDLDNLVMLCWVHHRLLHDSVWTVRIHNGRPQFIPPKWIDPTQTPR